MLPNELAKLAKAIEAQSEFVKGDTKKSQLNKTDARMVKAVTESDSMEEEAKVDIVDQSGIVQVVKKVHVLVVKNVTPFVIESGAYESIFHSSTDTWAKRYISENAEHVRAGLILGAKLGKKMKVRNEERDTKFTRLKAGVIDKRLISSLGFGAEAVFHKMEQFKYKPMYFHLSLDASGSMSGDRYYNCLRLAAAISKAASMVGNIRVVVDIRSTTNDRPVVAVLYDSNRDPLSKLITNLSHSHANGTTPEGLCYDVIMKDIIKKSNGTDAIFFNFSDGEPNYSNSEVQYTNMTAIEHTRKQVAKMQKAGINVISYFISEYVSESASNRFKAMYGKDAKFIDTKNIIQVSNSINERMLQIC
jgi:hypothetical protein